MVCVARCFEASGSRSAAFKSVYEAYHPDFHVACGLRLLSNPRSATQLLQDYQDRTPLHEAGTYYGVGHDVEFEGWKKQIISITGSTGVAKLAALLA